jgi:hypothetical protein
MTFRTNRLTRAPVFTSGILLSASTLWMATVLMPLSASASSLRCPTDRIEHPGPATAEQTQTIELLWKDAHGPGRDGGDGPLGCPTGDPRLISPGAPGTWSGVVQEFQRGTIMVGDGDNQNSRAVFVKAKGWTIWWTGLGLTPLPTVRDVKSTDKVPATWQHGGELFQIPDNGPVVALLQCPQERTFDGKNGDCVNFLPAVYKPSGPFDPAARLDRDKLTIPSATNEDFDARSDAIFADWLPCYTLPPRDDTGESGFARAMIRLKGNEVCPLTPSLPAGGPSLTPAQDTIAWLSRVAYPSEQKPGTSVDNFPCATREGELDVALASTLTLLLNHDDALDQASKDNLLSILDPWGVPARESPHVTPDGACFGFSLIESENHMLLQETSAYLINGLKGRITSTNSAWLEKMLGSIVRKDFYEFDAIPYSRYQLKALYLLHDHAPDPHMRQIAHGVLDWIFAKEAIAGNLDRDHRPFRRTFGHASTQPADWWGSAATPITTETALFAGPLQHAHADIDLQFARGADSSGRNALMEVAAYPLLATIPEYVTEALVDARTTKYRPSGPVMSWLVNRFTDESANRTTYVQAIGHPPTPPDDLTIFRQVRSGAEIQSGNRNWTIIGGGAPAPPGDPGPPEEATGTSVAAFLASLSAGAELGSLAGPLGSVFGSIIGLIIGPSELKAAVTKLQHDKLWGESGGQAGTIRETILIPTPIGLDRSQTLRFGRPANTSESPQLARLCVAEGFMCGYDFRPPTLMFTAQDVNNCNIKVTLPAALVAAFKARVGPGQTVNSVMGCPTVKAPGHLENGNWTIWWFDNGTLAFGLNDPVGRERFAGAWITGRTDTRAGDVRIAWDVRGDGYDWFRVHLYDTGVSPRGGEPPGGWLSPLLISGDPTDSTMNSDGDVQLKVGSTINDKDPDSVDTQTVPPSWDILIVGCKAYTTGHDCKDDRLPRLTVNVGPVPKQAFSCASAPPLKHSPTVASPPQMGLVTQSGSCEGGPYGFYTSILTFTCPGIIPSVLSLPDRTCPEGAMNFGFVVVAPSRGMDISDFNRIVENSVLRQSATGGGFAPGVTASIDVPIPAAATVGPGGLISQGAPTFHTVRFRLPVKSDMSAVSIIGDTGAPGLFTPSGIGRPFAAWPTAIGHVTAPDTPGAVTALLQNPGNGCFTMPGYPTPEEPDPRGLVVDIRKPTQPVLNEVRNSRLPGQCN